MTNIKVTSIGVGLGVTCVALLQIVLNHVVAPISPIAVWQFESILLSFTDNLGSWSGGRYLGLVFVVLLVVATFLPEPRYVVLLRKLRSVFHYMVVILVTMMSFSFFGNLSEYSVSDKWIASIEEETSETQREVIASLLIYNELSLNTEFRAYVRKGMQSVRSIGGSHHERVQEVRATVNNLISHSLDITLPDSKKDEGSSTRERTAIDSGETLEKPEKRETDLRILREVRMELVELGTNLIGEIANSTMSHPEQDSSRQLERLFMVAMVEGLAKSVLAAVDVDFGTSVERAKQWIGNVKSWKFQSQVDADTLEKPRPSQSHQLSKRSVRRDAKGETSVPISTTEVRSAENVMQGRKGESSPLRIKPPDYWSDWSSRVFVDPNGRVGRNREIPNIDDRVVRRLFAHQRTWSTVNLEQLAMELELDDFALRRLRALLERDMVGYVRRGIVNEIRIFGVDPQLEKISEIERYRLKRKLENAINSRSATSDFGAMGGIPKSLPYKRPSGPRSRPGR